MSERNLCHKAGCLPKPSCCTIVEVYLARTKVSEYFPEAKPKPADGAYIPGECYIIEPDNLLDLPSGSSVVVVYSPGDCPNLLSNGMCKFWPNHPPSCIFEKRGGPNCNRTRARDGRPPVKDDLAE